MKILYVTTAGTTMGFFISLIKELADAGNQVDIATNEKVMPLPDFFVKSGYHLFHMSWLRSPIKRENLLAIKELRRIVETGRYDIVHCHTPVAAACARLACKNARKTGTKVIYTAHGFHFYTGAPTKNWLLYYPMEKLLSRYTDILITINSEDYERAQKKFKANCSRQ